MIHSFILLARGQPMTKDDVPIVLFVGILFFLVGFVLLVYHLHKYFDKTQKYEGRIWFDILFFSIFILMGITVLTFAILKMNE